MSPRIIVAAIDDNQLLVVPMCACQLVVGSGQARPVKSRIGSFFSLPEIGGPRADFLALMQKLPKSFTCNAHAVLFFLRFYSRQRAGGSWASGSWVRTNGNRPGPGRTEKSRLLPALQPNCPVFLLAFFSTACTWRQCDLCPVSVAALW